MENPTQEQMQFLSLPHIKELLLNTLKKTNGVNITEAENILSKPISASQAHFTVAAIAGVPDLWAGITIAQVNGCGFSHDFTPDGLIVGEAQGFLVNVNDNWEALVDLATQFSVGGGGVAQAGLVVIFLSAQNQILGYFAATGYAVGAMYGTGSGTWSCS
jgi:hypothetical protein